MAEILQSQPEYYGDTDMMMIADPVKRGTALVALGILLLVVACEPNMQPTPRFIDSDGDGIADSNDAFPGDACAAADSDSDGDPDSIVSGCSTALTEDSDDDNDGIVDASDSQPLIPDCGGTPTATVRSQEGSADNPYCIDSLAELQSISGPFANSYTRANSFTVTDPLTLHYRLTANIDAWASNNLGETANPGRRPSSISYADGSSKRPPAAYDSAYSSGFTPIGPTFTGTFEGGGYTIHGLRIIAGAAGNWGLFAEISGDGAMVANLHLREVDIDGWQFVGALAGKLLSGALADGVSMSGTVTGASGGGRSEYIGGLVGRNDSATLQNSYASGVVDGRIGMTDFVAGLVGHNINGATVQNSYASGNVSGGAIAVSIVAGLVGYNINGATVRNSYASGDVNGGDAGVSVTVGGLLGVNDSILRNSYRNSDAIVRGGMINTLGTARTRAQLQVLTAAGTGWSSSNWDFGSSAQYPAVKNSDGLLLCGQPEPRAQCE